MKKSTLMLFGLDIHTFWMQIQTLRRSMLQFHQIMCILLSFELFDGNWQRWSMHEHLWFHVIFIWCATQRRRKLWIFVQYNQINLCSALMRQSYFSCLFARGGISAEMQQCSRNLVKKKRLLRASMEMSTITLENLQMSWQLRVAVCEHVCEYEMP